MVYYKLLEVFMMIRMSKEASDLVTKLAKKRGKSISDLLNEALGLEEIAVRTIERGEKMMVQDKKGNNFSIRFKDQRNAG